MAPIMRRIAVSVTVVLSFLVATAPAVSAHAVNGVGATNYVATITRIDPPVEGLKVELIESGNRIQLTNNTGQTVIVLGYTDEPYLRIETNGIYENLQSSAFYLNQTRKGDTPVPPDIKPKGPPEWKKVSDGNVVRFHDHRIHWVGQKPPIVLRQPGVVHTLIPDNVLPMQVGITKVSVHLKVDWVPGPSAIPWFVLGFFVALATVGLIAWRERIRLISVPIIALLLLIADSFYRLGILRNFRGSLLTVLSRDAEVILISQIAWIALIVAVYMGFRKHREAFTVAAFSAVALLFISILPDLGVLWLKVVPSAWSPNWSRLFVAMGLGSSSGIAISAVILRLQRRDVIPDAA